MEWSCLGFRFWVVVWKAADDKSEELTPIRWLIVLPPEIWSSIYQEATSPCYNPLPVIPSMVDTEIDTLTRKKLGAHRLTSTFQFASTKKVTNIFRWHTWPLLREIKRCFFHKEKIENWNVNLCQSHTRILRGTGSTSAKKQNKPCFLIWKRNRFKIIFVYPLYFF